MKKLEETEQRLLGDLQKKEAELSRNSKQLEKFKAEGAGASAALEDQMSEVIKRAETSELQMNQSYEKMKKMELETGKIRETLEKQTDLANASMELQKQLDKQMSAIGDQESKVSLKRYGGGTRLKRDYFLITNDRYKCSSRLESLHSANS